MLYKQKVLLLFKQKRRNEKNKLSDSEAGILLFSLSLEQNFSVLPAYLSDFSSLWLSVHLFFCLVHTCDTALFLFAAVREGACQCPGWESLGKDDTQDLKRCLSWVLKKKHS